MDTANDTLIGDKQSFQSFDSFTGGVWKVGWQGGREQSCFCDAAREEKVNIVC